MPFISVEGLKDFQLCERLYDYRHIEKMPEKIYSRDIYTEKFENTIKNIIFFFFYKKQSGVIPSYASLLNRWEKMWFPKNTTSYDIITEQHESVYGNVASLTSKAAAALLVFYENYSNSNFIPMAISEEYIVPSGKAYNIEDKFDLILYKDKTYYVTKILFNYRQTNKSQYVIDFCSMQAAYNNMNPPKMSQTRFGYIDMMSPNIQFNDFPINANDINSFNYWLEKLQGTKKFVPKRGLIPYCKKCPYDKPCSEWNGWDNEVTK